MKILHNFCRLFQKDDGAYFTYNLGVGFIRIAAGLFVISVFLLLYGHFLPGNTLRFYDSVKASVVSTDMQVHEHRSSRGPRTETYTYTAVFSGTYSDGGSFTLKQYVTKSAYATYSAIEGGNPIPMTLYKSSPGDDFFLSRSAQKKALKEYRDSNAALKLKKSVFLIATWFVLFGASIFATIGLHEMKIAMKYPRTDIPPELDENSGGSGKFIEDKALNERK